jgi:hypothetical protein
VYFRCVFCCLAEAHFTLGSGFVVDTLDELCGEFWVVVANGRRPLTSRPLYGWGGRAPRYSLNRNLGGRQSWSGRFAEGKDTLFARNRTLDRPVPGLDILPTTVFCEVGIEDLCTNQMNYSRHWLSVSGWDCQW